MASAPGIIQRYSRVAIVFHWTIATLVLLNLFLGLFHESLLDGVPVMPLHKSVGLLVLVLSIARLGWRLTHAAPPLPDALPTWEKRVARGAHWIFHALLIVLPLSGWAMSSSPARPRPVDWFGLFDVPVLPVTNALAGAAHETHEILGYTMAVLVALHIGAALRHHFLLRDSTLVQMLPGRD